MHNFNRPDKAASRVNEIASMTSQDILGYAQILLLLAGVAAWIRALRRGRAQQWLDAPNRLPPWTIRGSDFMLFALLVVVFLSLGPALAFRVFDMDVASKPAVRETLIQGFTFQLSGLTACLLFRIHPQGTPPPSPGFDLPAIWTGVCAFLYLMPIFSALVVATAWLMKAAGLDPEPQDLIETFRAAGTPLEITLLIILAVIVAPLTEELIFRAGVFRFLHARIPTAWAMGISSILFALLHQNTLTFPPLILLGCVLCALYQKTGRLSASIALHAMFNLNSVLVILFGPEV
ncbi:MAG: lysostaphin resistance A-like protein [Opitutaceae bacterium]